MTITREVREKVVQLSKEGHGRNEIARLLNGQVSEGSVGNIIRAYKRESLQGHSSEHTSQLQHHSSHNDAGIGIPTKAPQPETDASISIGVGLKTGTPILAPLENGVGQADIATIGTNSKSNFTIHRDGGSLLQILGNDSTDEVIAPDSPPPSIVSIPPTEQNRNPFISSIFVSHLVIIRIYSSCQIDCISVFVSQFY